MNIKWIGGTKFNPKYGLLEDNKTYDVSEEDGKRFTESGKAKSTKTKEEN